MKKILIRFFVTSLCCLSFTGCGPQKMYYFGNYSETLYSLEKKQNDESLLKHKKELESIISKSKTKNLPVPPGICAELGYIHLKAKNSKEAIKLFQMESQLYPESKHLMDRLIQKAGTKDNTESNLSDS